MKAKEVSGLAQIIAQSVAQSMGTLKDGMINSTEKKAITTQITKAKPPPIWIGEDFERFKAEVEAWDHNNTDPTMTKYSDLIESLKKNKNIKENDINVILDNATEIGDKSVEKVIKILEEKYRKTTIEKTKDILKDILEFEMKKEETFEEYWDRCEILITKCKREKVNEKFYYMMSAMIIDKAEKNGKLTEEEKRRLNESIEAEQDSDRVPKPENTVVENLKKEVKKLKIENNRSEVETKVHYGDRMSRRGTWEKWPDYKRNSRTNSNQSNNQRSGSRSNYQRSDSHPGLWRSKSGTNYRRFQSRTPTRQDSRGSQRDGSENRSDSLKERVT